MKCLLDINTPLAAILVAHSKHSFAATLDEGIVHEPIELVKWIPLIGSGHAPTTFHHNYTRSWHSEDGPQQSWF